MIYVSLLPAFLCFVINSFCLHELKYEVVRKDKNWHLSKQSQTALLFDGLTFFSVRDDTTITQLWHNDDTTTKFPRPCI